MLIWKFFGKSFIMCHVRDNFGHFWVCTLFHLPLIRSIIAFGCLQIIVTYHSSKLSIILIPRMEIMHVFQ